MTKSQSVNDRRMPKIHENKKMKVRFSTETVSPSISRNTEELKHDEEYDAYKINFDDFGDFMVEKVNETVAQRLMQHIKQTDNDNNQHIIPSAQCISILLFSCILYIKFKEKTE
eukprot:330893_1